MRKHYVKIQLQQIVENGFKNFFENSFQSTQNNNFFSRTRNGIWVSTNRHHVMVNIPCKKFAFVSHGTKWNSFRVAVKSSRYTYMNCMYTTTTATAMPLYPYISFQGTYFNASDESIAIFFMLNWHINFAVLLCCFTSYLCRHSVFFLSLPEHYCDF